NILDQMAFGLLHWSPDSQGVFFLDGRGMSVHLFRADLNGSLHQLTQGDGVFINASFDREARHIAYSAQDVEQAADLQFSVLGFRFSGDEGPTAWRLGEPQRLTDLNPQIAEWGMGRAEVVRWRSDDGREIEGIYVAPEAAQAGGAAPPLLVGIHGGPQGVTRRSFWLWGNPRYPFPFRLFAGLGYALLLPNPRGSGCYEPEFARANVGDWGGGDQRDIMTGVDHLIAAGLADPERLGVMGWSYGGFMTAWIVSQTGRFLAASVGAGPVNHVSMYGQTDIPRFVNYYFDGDHWDTPEAAAAYLRRSPVAFAGNITTPVLIHHGEKDERVPLPQGYELYRALRVRGVPVEMVVYPGAGHGLTDPRHQRYAMQRSLAWFTERIPVAQDGAE
ncbi:MAG: prolyl oligopeptidase family serine peptidase, partial [Chloroflexi bacterium]|nr:prolyl oligopeptidase family serine peptidase [Chloroflexota bacterium]